MSRIGVIGARGALGSFLVEHFRLAGFDVDAFSTRSEDPALRLDVLRDDPTNYVRDLDSVIYCAWSTHDRTIEAQMAHVDAASRCAEVCAGSGTQFIFTGTVLAAEATESQYGVHKFLAEQRVACAGGVCLRIGLLADDAYPFLVTQLRRMVKKFGPAAGILDWPVLPVSSMAVGEAIRAEIEGESAGALVWLAPREATSLAEVAAWGTSRTSRRSRGRSIVSAVARLPVRGGIVGRQVDALAGLIGAPLSGEECRDPANGPVPRDDWQRGLAPA